MMTTRETLTELIKQLRSVDQENSRTIDLQLRVIVSEINESQSHMNKPSYYSWFLDALLESLTTERISVFKRSTIELIDTIALLGPADLCFIVLLPKLVSAKDRLLVNHCVSLLEKFLVNGKLAELLWQQCCTEDPAIYTHELVVLLSSLPDRTANKLKKENSDLFLPATYVNLLSTEIAKTTKRVRDDILNNLSRSVQFLGILIGKLCSTGHGTLLFTELMRQTGVMLKTDFTLSRVLEMVVVHVPANSTEAVLVPLLQSAPSYGVVNRLLGDSVHRCRRTKFLLTNKLILHRHYGDVIILKNIIGYIASNSTEIFLESLENLLQVWSDRSYVQHACYEQQVYICSAITIFVAFIKKGNIKGCDDAVTSKVMMGVPHYLDSGVEKIRRLGMVMAEILTGLVSPQGEALKFEYEESDITLKIKMLLQEPVEFADKVGEFISEENVKDEGIKTETKGDTICQKGEIVSQNTTDTNIEDLDSDDDLQPYDLSKDIPASKVQTPKYLRQCMEGFLIREDPETFEVSLRASEKLILGNPTQAREIAEEFAMIILHTEDNYDTLNFAEDCRRALVALLSVAPRQVAEKLCTEFYARNYNIRQRLDILDALATAAQELAKTDPNSSCVGESFDVFKSSAALVGDTGWREIVDRRIAAKTRRFAHKTQELALTENRFGPVAGYFFFPLLYPSSTDPAVDIAGRDSVLLIRMLYTLGIILHASVNTTRVPKMASSLMEFMWLFRSHREAAVRRGVLFAICMLYLTVPGHVLSGELETNVRETKLWTEHVMANDTDDLCREMARQSLVLLVDDALVLLAVIVLLDAFRANAFFRQGSPATP